MGKLRESLKGKKAYITAAIGLLGAVVAWARRPDRHAGPAGGGVGCGAGSVYSGWHRQ